LDKGIIALLAVCLVAALVVSGCAQPAQSIEVQGILGIKSGECGKYSITTLAGQIYYPDLNAGFAKGLLEGDSLSVKGILLQEGSCQKIKVENAIVLERKGAAKYGAIVKADFALRLADGNLISTSVKEIAESAGFEIDGNKLQPIEFRAGLGNYVGKDGEIYPRVAEEAIGMRAGDEKRIILTPAEAEGIYDSSKIMKIPREEWPLPKGVDPDIGVEVTNVFGTYSVVKGFDENFIYFDMNPKYAGKSMEFWIKVIEVNNDAINDYKGIAEKNDTVKVDYVGSLMDGNVFDSSEGKQPLEFVVGAGQMIKGFDKAVLGMKVGDEKTVTIPPEEAYGESNPRLLLVMDKNSADYKARFDEDPMLGDEIDVNVVINGMDSIQTELSPKSTRIQ